MCFGDNDSSSVVPHQPTLSKPVPHSPVAMANDAIEDAKAAARILLQSALAELEEVGIQP